MKRLLLLFFSLLFSSPVPDPLVFDPAPGTTLVRAFEHEQDLVLDSMSILMDGYEVPSEYLPEMELDIHSLVRVVVTDRLVEIDEGRPRVLLRTYDELATSASSEFVMIPGDSALEEGSATSALEGRSVRFEWDPEGGSYAVAFTEDEGDLPEELAEDMGLRAFLPEDAVEEGDEWELDASVLHDVFRPGGDLAWDWSRSEGMRGEIEEAHAFDGTLTARLTGIDEGVAEIELEGSFHEEDESEGDLSDVPVADGTATTFRTRTYELEGILRWNVEAGHVAGLALASAIEMEMRTVKDPDQGGPEYQHTMVFSGDWACTLEISAP